MPKLTPAQGAADWLKGMQGAATKYKQGVANVTVAPGQLAARAADRYAAGVAQSVQKYARNVAAVTLGSWQKSSATKGAPRLASGAQQAQQKVAAVFQSLFQYIGQQTASLPPRGSLEDNLNRVVTFDRAMAQYQKPAGS